MKSTIIGIITAASLMVAGSAVAADTAMALLKKNECLGCHKMEGKLVGPGFAEVAKKYKNDASAAEKLSSKVSKGGSGVWGTMPMPPMSAVKPEDLKVIIAHILSNGK